jgi:hypothetical protein
MQSSPLHCCLFTVPLTTNHLPRHLFSNTLILRSSLSIRDQVPHPHNTTEKNDISVYINPYIFGYKTGGRNDSGPNGSSHSMNSVCS